MKKFFLLVLIIIFSFEIKAQEHNKNISFDDIINYVCENCRDTVTIINDTVVIVLTKKKTNEIFEKEEKTLPRVG